MRRESPLGYICDEESEMKFRRLKKIGAGLFVWFLGAIFSVGIFPPTPLSQGAGASRPVATVDGKAITEEELLEAARGEFIRLEAKAYQAKRDALKSLIFRLLVKEEAGRRGISLQELLMEEVDSKVEEPGEAELQSFYQRHRAQIRRPFGEIKADIRRYLVRGKRLQLRERLLVRLKKGRDIRILLEPPRVEVSPDDDPALGPTGAPVTIIEFSDFQCPYCARVQSTLKKLLKKYPKEIRLVFRDFPIERIHPQALKAAEASQCARDQGKFWPYHDLLFSNQRDLSIGALKGFARELDLELPQFERCLSKDKYQDEVRRDVQDGLKSGVNSTPTFFINGRLIRGAVSLEEFEAVVSEELRLRAEGK